MAVGLLNPSRFASGGGGGGYNAAVLTDTPLAYWKNAEPSGASMLDSSGNSRHATYTVAPVLGQTSLLTGDTETAADWQSDYAEIASASWMNVSALSLETWVRFDTVSAQQTLMIRDDTGANRDWILRLLSSGRLDWIVWNTSGTLQQCNPATTLSTATRYHVVATYGATHMKLYLNGSQIGSSVAITGTPRAIAQPIQIAGPGNRLDALGQKWGIYGTELSAARVAAHYAAGV